MERWKRIALWGLVVLLVFSFAVCQKKTQQAKTDKPAKEAELSSAPEEETKTPEEETKTEEAVKAEETPEIGEKPTGLVKEIATEDAVAVIELEKGGQIVFEFYAKDAPGTVDNFIKLTNKGFYDGLTFHRVVPGFVVQGGCPTGDGTGGPGYRVKAEFNSQKHLKGAVAMARSTHPDSAGSQFYICLEPQPGLDGQYTVFGQLIEGMELVDGLLFSIGLEAYSDLDNGNIPEILRRKFESSGRSLSDSAAVSTQVASLRWVIADGDKTYAINAEVDKLNVLTQGIQMGDVMKKVTIVDKASLEK